jgi:PAS domain S-box-containing protein
MSYYTQTENGIQKLQAEHQELMTFFNAMDEVFFSVDMINLKVIQISVGCEKIYGYKQADFMANHLFWFNLIHPEDKHVIKSQDDILQNGLPVDYQYRIIRKDGAVRWVENKIIPRLDENGKLMRVDGITRDITARKEADEKHRKSEVRFQQIVETAQEGIWTIDEYEKTNFVNKKICDLLGYSPAEMMGKGLYDFMDAAGKADAIACMERRRNGSKENLDVRYVTKSGGEIWANISTSPIFDETGVYKGALAMVTDITQRKLDADALKKSEANMRTIFDYAESAYIFFDTDLNTISFNEVAQKDSVERDGKKLEVNKPIKEYFKEERWPIIKEIINKVISDGAVMYETNYTRVDGDPQWNNVRWLSVKNDNDEILGFIFTHRDVTPEKIASLERERLTNDLIQHIKDLEQFTYIISHNLRAPVANIIGLSDILKGHELDTGTKDEVVEKISTSTKNIDTVIRDLNQILEVRELVDKKKEIVYFSELVDAIKTNIYNTLIDKNVDFRCAFEDVEATSTIRSYLYSIFYNLLSNSIKYRKTDAPLLIVIKSLKLNDKIELSFKDNGKGIDLKKNGQQLFGLYKRFDTTMEGKGMGLFMVKTQAEALGGTIKVKSTLSEGTEFTITLPA